jgi:protein ImuB
MARLFACIISPDIKRDKAPLKAVAREFSYLIKILVDGILFDVSGLERIVGDRDAVSEKILEGLRRENVSGSVAIAETIDSACLLARQNSGSAHAFHSSEGFSKLPLSDLPIEQDILNVFTDLGVRRVEDLLAIPHDELITRYGKDFRNIIDVIEQKSSSMLVPNVKEHLVKWSYDLDLPVQDFEQLIFLLNHGFEKLFAAIKSIGLSTEHLDIAFTLKSLPAKSYEIKTSFPTLERAFWLKLVNLRVSLDPPEADIVAVSVTAHFTKPRPSQRGLYAVSRPEPESLLLTVNKLKKMVGEENVGLPVILNQRRSQPFSLDPDLLPSGVVSNQLEPRLPTLAFTYYRPPQRAEVVYRDGRLVFIRTRCFDGYVSEYSGVWKGNSFWWDKPWKTQEWDVEIENRGIYRLCKVNRDWFLLGEYD